MSDYPYQKQVFSTSGVWPHTTSQPGPRTLRSRLVEISQKAAWSLKAKNGLVELARAVIDLTEVVYEMHAPPLEGKVEWFDEGFGPEKAVELAQRDSRVLGDALIEAKKENEALERKLDEARKELNAARHRMNTARNYLTGEGF